MAGAMCAFWLAGRAATANNAASLAGLAMIVVAVFGYDAETPFPSLYALLPVAGSALIILFAGAGTWAGALLASRPFVGIGLISYSSYLWHQPLFAFARLASLEPPGLPLMLALAGLALVLAWLSWRYVEAPFRKGAASLLPSQRSVFVASAAGALLFVGVGGAVMAFQPALQRHWLAGHPSIAANYQLVQYSKEHRNLGARLDGPQRFSECRFNVATIDAKVEAALIACARRHGPGVMVLGDSHAIDLFGVLASRFDAPFLVGITQGFCRPHKPMPQCQYDGMLRFVAAHPQSLRAIYYTQAGFYLMLDERGNKGARTMFANRGLADSVGRITPDPDHIGKTAAYLDELARHVPVQWLGPIIEPHMPKKLILTQGCAGAYALRPQQAAVFRQLDAELARRATGARYRYRSMIDLYDLDLARDFCVGGQLAFNDGDHFTAAGETMFGRRLPADFLN